MTFWSCLASFILFLKRITKKGVENWTGTDRQMDGGQRTTGTLNCKSIFLNAWNLISVSIYHFRQQRVLIDLHFSPADQFLFLIPWHVLSPPPFPTDIMSELKCRTLRVTSYSTFVTLIISCPEVQCPFAMLPEIGFLLLDHYPNAASHILVTVSTWVFFRSL